MQPLKKIAHLYQRLINVEILLKTVETYTHKCRLKYAYYFFPHALNRW